MSSKFDLALVVSKATSFASISCTSDEEPVTGPPLCGALALPFPPPWVTAERERSDELALKSFDHLAPYLRRCPSQPHREDFAEREQELAGELRPRGLEGCVLLWRHRRHLAVIHRPDTRRPWIAVEEGLLTEHRTSPRSGEGAYAYAIAGVNEHL